jgi:Ca-activated chloride channel family protein
MPSSPEWEALLAGAVLLEHPVVVRAGGALLLLLLATALVRGPLRVRVPEQRSHAGRFAGSGRLAAALDPAWLSSLALRGGALALVLVTLASPVGLIRENPAGGEGIDLVIALDASGSMDALDGQLEGARVTRLELAKAVVAQFIRARDGDRIGLVAFGAHAFTQCPLTADHRMVLAALERIEVGVAGDRTALGEAIGLASMRLRAPGAPPEAQRTLLLLTDGRHNAGQLAPATAAELARRNGVRIHAVGIGSSGKEVPFAQKSPGEPLRFEKVDLDRETLDVVAAHTGGRFFHARRPEDLHDVARAIDATLVRPQTPEPRYRRAALAPLTLLAALGLLLGETLLAHGLLRRLP